MQIKNKAEILSVLNMPEDIFFEEIVPEAQKTFEATKGRNLTVTAMLGYDNICKNQCLYCGMRAGNHTISRYRMSAQDVIFAGTAALDAGFHRMFLISGEDPKYGFDNLLRIIETLHQKGLYLSLACGEFSAEQYREIRAAGADEYVMKFEMSHPDSFNRLNPSTDFNRRMAAIDAIKQSDMRLASGNIIGWPGQTMEELADDILLCQQLEISWAPVIPYMPAMNTPLAAEGGPGDLLTAWKEIALLRLMIPDVNITAQQPGKILKNGLNDDFGNQKAIDAGANVLFCDFLPDIKARNFRVIDYRNVTGTSHLYHIAELTHMNLQF